MSRAFYASLYASLLTLLSIALLLTYPPLILIHEGQHFLRGLSFSSLDKNDTLPVSIYQFIGIASRPPPGSKHYVALTDAGLFPVPKEASGITLQDAIRQPYAVYPAVARYPVIDYLPTIIAGCIGDIFQFRPVVIFT